MNLANSLRLYLRYAGISIRSQMEYRASFILQMLGNLLGTGIEFLGIWALFDRFGSIRGWELAHIALFYGTVNVTFSVTEGLVGGLDSFADMIKSGDLDRLFVRPRSIAFQVAAREIQLRRIGAIAQGLAVLLWAASTVGVEWTPGRVGLLLFCMAGGGCLFAGLFVLQATLAFWTTESLEIMNTMTYGGRETAQYPLTIYRDWFRRFFTAVVPLACVAYYPLTVIVGRSDPGGPSALVRAALPLVGAAFLVVALGVWRVGVRRYRSTGS